MPLKCIHYVTPEQKVVVEARLNNGYEMIGVTRSMINGLDAYLICKGKHTMCINSLGYCENYFGATWVIHKGFEE